MSILSEYRKKHPRKSCATPDCKYIAIPNCRFCLCCRDQMLSKVDQVLGIPPYIGRPRDTGRRENRTETRNG